MDRKEELQQLQQSNPDAFTKEQLKELKDIDKQVASIDASLKNIEDMEKSATQIKPGTEKLVQLKIAFGNRFSARTGKEINKPQPVSFSFGEWQLFKESYKRLGYQVTEVINDPYGDAEALVEVQKD